MHQLFAKNFIKARKSSGYTQKTLAKQLGMKYSAIGSYEEGRAIPKYPELFRICDLFYIKDIRAFISDPAFTPPCVHSWEIVGDKLKCLKCPEQKSYNEN